MKEDKITSKNYYRASFFPRLWYKFKFSLTEWLRNFRLPLGKIIGLLIIALISFSVYMIVKVNAIMIPIRAPYPHTIAEGFVNGRELKKDGLLSTKVYENDRFIFEFNEASTHFTITNKTNLQLWSSCPIEMDEKGAPKVLMDRDILVVYYYKALGTPSSMGTYKYAVKEEIVNNENFGTSYWLRYNDFEQSIEVLYEISSKGLSTLDVPTQISFERFEEKILSKINPIDAETLKILYKKIDSLHAWVLPDVGSVALANIDRMLKEAGYTKDDLAYDNADQGIAYEDTRANFEVAVKYRLTPNGLETKIINDSIVEKENAPVVYIDLLPFFGVGGKNDTGYVVIPEGSGILINHNNGINYPGKRLYGEDIANSKDIKPNENLNISLPVYGYKKNNGGFITVIKDGAAMATMIANNASSSNPYNTAYFRFNYREGAAYEFVTWRTVQPITVWTKYYSLADYTIEYRFTDQETIEYPDLANMYRFYLIETGLEPKKLNDDLILNITLLGGYEYQTTFLGLPTVKVKSLTNYDQAREIIDELKEDKIDALSILFQGWMNNGIRHYSATKIKNESVVGTRKELIAFGAYLANLGIDFYPEMYMNTIYTDKNFNRRNDSVRSIFANVVEKYRFSPATLRSDYTTTPYYTLKATSYDKVIEKILKSYRNQNQENISFIDLGNALSGSYRNKDTVFRNQTEQSSIEVLETIRKNNLKLINLHNPSNYTFKYVDNAVDVSMYGPQSKAISLSIPFYQLVVSGLFEYAQDAINLFDNYSYQTHVLKTIETGSNLHFIWSYENTLNLTKTEYSNYYSTYYKNWYDRAVATYHEINKLKISGARLINHQYLNNNNKLVMVTYDNNKTIYLNYSNVNINYNGYEILAMNYKVVE